MTHPAVAVALEWWRCSGPRTRERLGSLIEHFGDVYGVPREQRAALLEEAWRRIPSGQKAARSPS